MKPFSLLRALVVATAAIAAAAGADAQPFRYSVTHFELSSPRINPRKINNHGHLAGSFHAAPGVFPNDFYFDGVSTVDLGVIAVLGLNDVRQVVGSATAANGARHAFLWDDGVSRDLGLLTGANPDFGESFGDALNNASHVAGRSSTPHGVGTLRPFLWGDGQMVRLPTLNDYLGRPYAMNDLDQIVGEAAEAIVPGRPVMWVNGQIHELGTLGGRGGNASDINNRSQIVGWSDTPGDALRHAFLWQSGTMTDLGTLAGDSYSAAIAINNHGAIVGWSNHAWSSGGDGDRSRAFIFENGQMAALNELVDLQSEGISGIVGVFDVNDRGQILCRDLQRTYLLTPIDMPAPPANDDFASRMALDSADFVRVTNASNINATRERGEPFPTPGSGATGGSSVWWTWTAPRSGRATVSTTECDFDSIASVSTGDSLAALTEIARGDTIDPDSGYEHAVITFDAVAGTSYNIAIDGHRSGTGDVVFEVFLPPENDDFANRTPIVGVATGVSGRVRGVTEDAGLPVDLQAFAGPAAWWRWTAPSDGLATVRIAGRPEGNLTVLHGSSIAELTYVTGGRSVALQNQTAVFPALAGVEYVFSVSWNIDDILFLLPFVESGPMPYSLRLDLAPFAAQTATPTVDAGGSTTLSLTDIVVSTIHNGFPRTLTHQWDEAGVITSLSGQLLGRQNLAFQWRFNGVNIPGATSSTYTLPSAQLFQAGSYGVVVSLGGASVSSAPSNVAVVAPTPSGARVSNISTRAIGLAGEVALIPGFVVEGAATKDLLVRAIGPQLAAFGVTDLMADPRMTLKRRVGNDWLDLATNDDWGTNVNAADLVAVGQRVGAFDLVAGGKDAALLVSVPAGVYCALVTGANGNGGAVMVELYDADTPPGDTRLVNISNRGHVGTGAGIMIPGFVVSQEGSKTFLVRAVGPGLAQWGVTDILDDPRLHIFRLVGGSAPAQLILINDNWGENGDAARIVEVSEQVGAFSLAVGSADAAFVVTLAPGVYTAHVRGVADTTGEALAEIYQVP